MKISVVMPAYNAERYIEASMGSVLTQTWRDLELIVVDDCSRDATPEKVRRMAERDERVIYLRNERNSGASASRNRGVQAAGGEWIAFLDSDDLWRKDKLERQMALVKQHPDAVLCYTASGFMDEDGRTYEYVMEAEERMTYRGLLRKNIMTCSSVLLRRDAALRYPMPGDDLHEDYAVWLSVLREFPCAYGLNEALVVYRLRKQSKSGDRMRSARMLFRTYRYVGFSAARSAFLTARYAGYSIAKRRRVTKRRGTNQ